MMSLGWIIVGIFPFCPNTTSSIYSLFSLMRLHVSPTKGPPFPASHESGPGPWPNSDEQTHILRCGRNYSECILVWLGSCILFAEATGDNDGGIVGAPNGQCCYGWWNYLRCLHPGVVAVMYSWDKFYNMNLGISLVERSL